MIPTTLTSSSSSTSSPSTTTAAGSNQKNLSAAFTGIVALILEGRAIAEDEFQRSTPPQAHLPTARHSAVVVNAANYKDYDLTSFHTNSFCSGFAGGGGGGAAGGRQSPKPSTSRAAAISTNFSTTSRNVVNITTNPQAFGFPHSGVCDEIIGDSTFAETTPHQRWTQKLCQLRQSSPAATTVGRRRDYEQQVAVEAGESELVALAINTDTAEKAGDFEVVRRVMLNRSNLPASGGSASSSPGSTENFLHSLQSLATTCLRAGSPSVETGMRYGSPNAAAFGSSGAPIYNKFRATERAPRGTNPFAHEVHGSASSSGSGIQSPQSSAMWSPTGTPLSGCSGAGGASSRCNRREQFMRESTLATSRITIPSSTRNTAAPAATSTLKSPTTTSTYPQQGPHCEQFLRKMGLAKGEAMEAEDHVCDMSYVNITCSRWRAYCLKMDGFIQRGEPVCIEVYLGPVRHKILLEQWIISQKDKVLPPTMTLPSLCSAIRSQLYFSQISAWCDLIKKSDETIYETERVIFPTPTGAAGDLATISATMSTPGTSPNASSHSSPSPTLHAPRRPRLNIFYRIKQFDSTACFNSQPNVHNFPNVIIADGCNISVCLKSLPRINGGIPKLGAPTAAADFKTSPTISAFAGVASTTSTSASAATTTATLETSAASTSKTSRCALAEEPTTSAASAASNCDNKKTIAFAVDSAAVTKSMVTSAYGSKPDKCMFYTDEEEELPTDAQIIEDDADDDDECTNGSSFGDGSSSSFHCTLSHREKQLLKYRKRMQKRDKKTTRKVETLHLEHALKTAHGSNAQPMEQGDEEDEYRPKDEEGCARKSHHDRPPQKQVQSKVSECHPSPSSHVAMISTGTQTQANCCQCGGEKALICLSCDNSTIFGASAAARKPPALDDMDSMDSCSISSSEIIHTPRNSAELLLQAIQRTPKAAKNKKQALRRSTSSIPSGTTETSKNNNHMGCESIGSLGDGGEGGGADGAGGPTGCQVCKRQKTQHNFSVSSNSVSGGILEDGEEFTCEEEGDESDGKPKSPVTRSASRSNNAPSQEIQSDSGIVDEDQECFLSSTKLTPHFDRCSLYKNNNNNISCKHMRIDNAENTAISHCRSCTPPNSGTLSDAAVLLVNCEGSFKTPSNSPLPSEHYHQHKQTPKPTMLQSAGRCYHHGAAGDASQTNGGHFEATSSPLSTQHNPLLLRKGLPKVNLTPIFCSPSAVVSDLSSPSCFSTKPIPISSSPVITTKTTSVCFDHMAIANGGPNAVTAVDSNNIPVQKSTSAPTLPNTPSPSLSPRFAKQAAIYKRRSRHLSDRSDRSSLGSDEQISDEELELGTIGLYSPATSPLKMRARVAVQFGRRALLGNLEETLLQRRLMPKIEVIGFKVLLGASGGFCPTQLTIPAASYFYELHGAALSTPYVCEIRLPRKGYSIPRAGTVQATLLNPMGTVVRMFVIPYDMRDMPPLHQTFIRQRVLAEASTNETIATFEKATVRENFGSNNNNSIGYQSGMNGFGDAATNGVKNTTNYANSDNNSSEGNNNNNSGKNKYRLSPNGGLHGDSNLGHFISAENMKRLRYSIHLRFQTSRSGRLSLHTDIRLLISRRTDCDTAAAHAKGVLEAPNDLVTDTVMPTDPKYSARQESPSKI